MIFLSDVLAETHPILDGCYCYYLSLFCIVKSAQHDLSINQSII